MNVGYHQIYTWREETPEEYQAFHTLFRKGASQVFIDRLKHSDDECPILQRLIEEIKQGDFVYTWTLKSFGNTLDKLTNIIKQIESKGAEIVLIKDNVDSALLTDRKISDIITLYRKIAFAFKREDTLIRDLYDHANIGMVLIGMPGIEKRLSRYPQFYSRIGFAHEYKLLTIQQAEQVIQHYWKEIVGKMNTEQKEYKDTVVVIMRISNGNFRLIQRLFKQIKRVLKINDLKEITVEVVEAARDCLVIGEI